jgi:hypothetical protein
MIVLANRFVHNKCGIIMKYITAIRTPLEFVAEISRSGVVVRCRPSEVRATTLTVYIYNATRKKRSHNYHPTPATSRGKDFSSLDHRPSRRFFPDIPRFTIQTTTQPFEHPFFTAFLLLFILMASEQYWIIFAVPEVLWVILMCWRALFTGR